MIVDREILYLVDDDEAVRESLSVLLESYDFPVEAFGSAREFLAACPIDSKGCLLTDIRMPDMDGLALQEHVAKAVPGLGVIVMTGHADVPLAVRAMKAGAVDFLEKPFTAEAAVASIREAFARDATPPEGRIHATAEIRSRLQSLTPREREVLDGLVAGYPNKTIGYDLGISPRTVDILRGRVMDKMQAGSLPELVRFALVLGIGA